MSRERGVFRRVFIGWLDRSHEPSSGSVQPEPGCQGRTADDSRQIGRVKAFPTGQHEQLPIGVIEAAEGRHRRNSVRACGVVADERPMEVSAEAVD
jgi:hypothetical protein